MAEQSDIDGSHIDHAPEGYDAMAVLLHDSGAFKKLLLGQIDNESEVVDELATQLHVTRQNAEALLHIFWEKALQCWITYLYGQNAVNRPIDLVPDKLRAFLEEQKRDLASRMNASGQNDIAENFELYGKLVGPRGSELRTEVLHPIHRTHTPALRNRIVPQVGALYDETAEALRCMYSGDAQSAELESSTDSVPKFEDAEILYERAVLEQGILEAQTLREAQWTQASESETPDIEKPEEIALFVQRLLSYDTASITRLPEYVRAGNAIGIPHFDVPLNTVIGMSNAERTTLVNSLLKAAEPGARLLSKKEAIHARRLAESIGRLDGVQENVAIPESHWPLLLARKQAKSKKAQDWQNTPEEQSEYVRNLFENAQEFVNIFATLGTVPTELYRHEDFAVDANNGAEGKNRLRKLIEFHAQLRSLEADNSAITGGEAPVQRLKHERTKLISHAVLSGIATAATPPNERADAIDIDTNGIWFHLRVEGKQGKPATLESHVRYCDCTDELVSRLQVDGWITLAQTDEILFRREKSGLNFTEVAELEDRKRKTFLSAAGRDGRFALTAQDNVAQVLFRDSDTQEALADMLVESHLSGVPVHLPESLIDEYIAGEEDRKGYDTAMRMFSVAEMMQKMISQELMGETTLESYDPSERARRRYTLRESTINSPASTEAMRIVGRWLEHGASPEEDDGTIFRGVYRDTRSKRDQHFVEVLHEGNARRVLLDPVKHLSGEQREQFFRLPELDRKSYEEYETCVTVYEHTNRMIGILERQAARAASEDVSAEEVRKAVVELQFFIVSEFPERYGDVSPFINDLLTEPPTVQTLDACATALRVCLSSYEKRLFEGGPVDALRRITGTVERKEVGFDNLAQEYEAHTGKKCDEDLCALVSQKNHTIQVVESGHMSSSVPFAMEGKAIRALRLDTDRPLISVIGGCKKVDASKSSTGSPIETMCENIMDAAHTLKANVAPAGTQSGGLLDQLSRQYVEYSQHNRDVPPKEKARFFSVCPGGETYYPGNTYIKPQEQDKWSCHPIAPFDAIVTPLPAGWSWKGERKRNAPYFEFVAYMDAIYKRLSANQARITVIGNGGLFTIVEAVAAAKSGADIVLTENTGRFADLAIAIHNTGLTGTEQNFDEQVHSLIHEKITSEDRGQLLKDFGEELETDDEVQKLYREQLRLYVQLSRDASVHISSPDSLSSVIQSIAGHEYS